MFILPIPDSPVQAAIIQAAATPEIPDFGESPFWRAIGTIAILLLTVAMWFKAEWSGQKKGHGSDPGPPGRSDVHMHFDGPIAEAAAQLKRIADAAEQIPEAANMLMTIRDDLKKLVDESRHTNRTELHKEVQATEARIDSVDSRLREATESLAHLRGQVSAQRPTRGA